MAKTFLKMSPKIVGRVIRIPEPKTIIVRRAMNYRHPKYDVNMRRYRDFHVYDHHELAQIGDIVKIHPVPLNEKVRHFLGDIKRTVDLGNPHWPKPTAA